MIKKPSSRSFRGNKRGSGDSKSLNVYSNLSARRRLGRDSRSRKHAEYLATLPKSPLKRIAYRIHPKRVFAYWFSREGGIMALKIAGIGALVMVLTVGALFAYYRRELDAIRPEEINKRVQTTVTKYYDRNNVLLWEDAGTGNYQLVVEADKISKYMKNATVAIEDKDFYAHQGVSPTGIIRATFNNFSGGSTQGGSTLTQQLVKQVFLADEAQDRGLSGIPRKIKEAILAIEIERMYNKDQILALYLNESPYGGRRNGVESAAQTYFGKSAKDLTLAESALLASIPQQPGLYDPYNKEGNAFLVERQHRVLDNMAEQGYITRAEAADAKKVAVLDTLQDETTTYGNIKAPHFLTDVVRTQLEKELGEKTVGNGGLIVKTTLDIRMQNVVDREMDALFASSKPTTAGFDNGAATLIDVPTGQILALRGSRDFNYPGYGQENAADAYIQPGSSIKPLVFAGLFKQKTDQANYGAGTILRDEPINNLYGAELNNFDKKFRGDITIRSGLAESRNVPAVKAYLISGRETTLNTIRDLGDPSYCTQGVDSQAGPSMAIGGCTLKQIEHVNAFATLARMGEYKPPSSILEVKNGSGQVIKKWKDEGKQVIDPQVPYILSDILSDDAARAPSFGRGAQGLNVPGVKTATKTGTSNLGESSKDLWMMSYSPRISMGIWVGNHVPKEMRSAQSTLVGPTVGNVMKEVHTDILAKDGTWKIGDWFTQPAGIQRLSVSGRTDIFPSWYQKTTRGSESAQDFDSVSKKKATDCTPSRARQSLTVSRYQDPVTKREAVIAPAGYDATKDDDLHKCDDIKPTIGSVSVDKSGNTYTLKASVTQGTHGLSSVEFRVGGSIVGTVSASANGEYSTSYTPSSSGSQEVTATVIDSALYDATSPAKQQNF